MAKENEDFLESNLFPVYIIVDAFASCRTGLICAELDIDSFSVIDDDYRFIHEGYKHAISFLLDKLGVKCLLAELDLKDALTFKRWQDGKTVPTVEQKRELFDLYNTHNK